MAKRGGNGIRTHPAISCTSLPRSRPRPRHSFLKQQRGLQDFGEGIIRVRPIAPFQKIIAHPCKGGEGQAPSSIQDPSALLLYLRGLPYRTSSKISDSFNTPSPPCPHLELIYQYYTIHATYFVCFFPSPPLVRTSYKEAPLRNA